jgi:hypothetical protein
MFIPNPDPRSRGQKGAGSRIQIRNTDYMLLFAGPAASATNVGAGSPRTTSSPRAAGAGAGARQRKGASTTTAARTGGRAGGTSSGGMWRFYTDDSPGVKASSKTIF